MPRYLGRAGLDSAIGTEAVPALERLAANPNYLEATRQRFGDEPPPYHSSTEEDEDIPPPMYQKIPPGSSLPSEITDVIDQPLEGAAMEDLASYSIGSDQPRDRFELESRVEEARIGNFASTLERDAEMKTWLDAHEGRWRRKILARHFVKKRWQKLGVWNPQWGIPGRFKPRDGDFPECWKWKWQDDGPVHQDWKDTPAPRAALLRRGLRRGEYGPLPPRSSITESTSVSQAESFITSRPWFVFQLDVGEELIRETALPGHLWHKYSLRGEVIRRWKERGDWRDKAPGVGWKWRHESPSPEPEDLTQYSAIDDLDLTPSEVDAMDTIPPPTPPSIPVYVPPASPYVFPPGSLFGRPGELAAGPAELGSASPSPAPSSPPSPPQPPRHQPGRPRRDRRQSSGKAALPETHPPRRSARIAARQAVREAQASAGAAPEGGPRLRTRPSRTPQTKTRGSATKSGGRQKAGRSSPTTRVAAATPQGVAKRGRRGRG